MSSIEDLEAHRVELTGFCYRMLGSPFDAEDAVQETLLRAWKAAGRFDAARGSLRTWLFTIAANVCVDMLRGASRRALTVDLASPAAPGSAMGMPLPESAFVAPVPSARVLPASGDPADLAVQRESVRLAFVAALQVLPPRQRAVLILRDVLAWSAAEVAELLGTSVAAVNSALQRARTALPSPRAAGPVDRALLERYVAAFTDHDVDTLVAVLHEDATMSMPPLTWWLRGRTAIETVLRHSDACRGDTFTPVDANGTPALAQYRDGAPFAVVLFTGADDLITSVTTFLDPRLFALFPETSGSSAAT